jgi:putative hydrolase of the HAD superfamily
VGDIRTADLDAVTLDVYGTLVTLVDPVPKLADALRTRGVERSEDRIAAGLEAEMAYYGPRSHEGADVESLARLGEACARVFLEAVGSDLPPDEFAPTYVEALEFEVVPGVPNALRALRARGLELAVCSNWDVSLHERLAALGLSPFFTHVVTAAEVGARKPDPAPFRRALELLAVPPERALHVGDDASDRNGALAAGMRFAPAPLEHVIEELT